MTEPAAAPGVRDPSTPAVDRPKPCVRTASPTDADTIHRFIVALCVYENEPVETVQATPETLMDQLSSDRPPFECLIVSCDGTDVGMALFFQNFSTWTGKPGIWLEDLFVLPDQRGKGAGSALLSSLAAICVERGYSRLDWSCLKWNQPSIDFYQSVGAFSMDEWVNFRLTGEPLVAMARRGQLPL